MDQSNNNIQGEDCNLSRWSLLKASLNNLAFSKFLSLIEEFPDAVILDVRTPEEFSSENIKGSINVDYLSPELADELEALNPNKTYFVYCRTGRRSARVCVILRNLGFEKVFNLGAGLSNPNPISSKSSIE